ncbi:MAG TPA: V-type ATP synthase subunit I [Thermoplasmata archaeon]|nr:V-type ATP synthase subunit I [Thermoplasmata archaeon]
MSRALIVGPRDALERSVEVLYQLKLLHIVDHQQGESELDIGKPLPAATEASEVLVKLRSIANILQVQEPKATSAAEDVEQPPEGDLRSKILALELNLSEQDASKKKIQGLVADLNRRVEEITPFAQLPLSLEDYRGYESLEVFVGKVPREITGLETVTPEYESFSVPGFLVVFVAKAHAGRMRDFLAQSGFTSVPVPEGREPPREILANLLAERDRWEKRLKDIEETLTTLRERYAQFLTAAKSRLEIEVEKAEAPLRFAVTDHTFIVEGWVPSERFAPMKEGLESLDGVFVEKLETAGHEEPETEPEPPVLLKNPRPVRPFQTLVNLFGTPSYKEIDPSILIASVFPIFFGIMVSDAGYGLAWILFGTWAVKRYLKTPFWKDVITAITWGGFWAFIFGFFVFAEAFGIPFHAPPGSAPGTAAYFNWSDSILHFDIPIHPVMEKLTQVPDFIVLAVLAAYIHLGIGFVTGFFDEIRHNVKHAVGKAAWLLILTSLFIIILVRAARWPVDPEGRVPLGYALWNGPLAWFPHGGITMSSVGFGATNPIPMAALILLGVGLVVMLATEGAMHIMEIFGLLANMISYARLAGIGVAEEAVTFALNSIILGGMIIPWMNGSSFVFLIVGLVFFALAQIVLFLLYAISATIQSIRLNYVEFFLKFYKGTGTLFRPFGERTTTEV